MKSLVYLAICLALNVGIATLSQGKDTQPAAFENLSDEEKKQFIALFKKAMEKKTENSRTVAPTTITKESTRSKKEKLDLLFDEFFSHYLEEKNKPTTMTITMPPKKDHDDMADMVQAFKEWLESRKEKPSTLDQEPTRMKTTKKTPTVKPATKATKGTIGKERLFDEFKKYKKFKEWWNSKEKSTTAQPTTEVKEEKKKPSTVKPTTTKKPSTVKPTTTKKPSTVQPTTTKKPSTVQPTTTTKKPSTVQPTTTKKPSTVKPTTTKKPSTVQPTTTKKPSTVKPTTTKKPSTVQPTTTKKPSTVQPTTTTKKPSTVQPTTTKKPSTVQPTTKAKNATENTTTGNLTTEAKNGTENATTVSPAEEAESSSADSKFDLGLTEWINHHFSIFFMVTITLIILLSFAYYNRKKIQKKIKDIKHSKKRGGYVKVKLDDEVELPREANREFVY